MSSSKSSKRAILTTRDLEVVRFLEDHNLVMTSKQIATMFYKTPKNNENSALNTAQKRLKLLVDKKYLRSVRNYIGQQYIYFTTLKAPRNPEHKLLIAETIVRLNHEFNLTNIQIEYTGFLKYHIRPDLYVEINIPDQGRYNLIIECDITKKFENGEAYKKMIKARDSSQEATKENGLFNVRYCFKKGRTLLISVCDTQPNVAGLNVNWVKTDFSNLDILLDVFK